MYRWLGSHPAAGTGQTFKVTRCGNVLTGAICRGVIVGVYVLTDVLWLSVRGVKRRGVTGTEKIAQMACDSASVALLKNVRIVACGIAIRVKSRHGVLTRRAGSVRVRVLGAGVRIVSN